MRKFSGVKEIIKKSNKNARNQDYNKRDEDYS